MKRRKKIRPEELCFDCLVGPEIKQKYCNPPRSRLLITTIPSGMYVLNDDGVNLSLQAAGEIIVESMNKLSNIGVAVRDVESEEVSYHLQFFCGFISLEFQFIVSLILLIQIS